MDQQNVSRNRFFYFARPVNVFLKAVGVYLFLPDASKGSSETMSSISYWKGKFLFAWSRFWLLLNTQSGCYIFFRRGYAGHVYKILFDSKLLIGGKLTDELTGALMRLSVFILLETLVHYMLVLSIQGTFQRFFGTLEPFYHKIDIQNCPKFDVSPMHVYWRLYPWDGKIVMSTALY